MPSLNLNLNDEAWKILEELSQKSGKPKAEIIRNALMLIYLAHEEQEKNHYLGIVDAETHNVTTKLVNIL